MASFHAKIGWKRLRKIENKKLSFRSVLTRCVIENYKKKAKKFKNTIMVSFEAKIGWKKGWEREKLKIFVPFRSRREIETSKKIAEKFQNLKNIFMDSFQAKIGWRRMRKRENKDYHSVPTRLLIENSKNIQKIKKIPLWLHFKPK